MLRRRLIPPIVVRAIVLGTAVAAFVGFSLAGAADGGSARAGLTRTTAAISGSSDARPTASVGESRSGMVDAAALDRTERLGEVGRRDGRSATRHQWTLDWAVALAVAAVVLAALSITIARRRTGHPTIRIGRVAPARAPPLSIACT